jgi:hypothetical protein
MVVVTADAGPRTCGGIVDGDGLSRDGPSLLARLIRCVMMPGRLNHQLSGMGVRGSWVIEL